MDVIYTENGSYEVHTNGTRVVPITIDVRNKEEEVYVQQKEVVVTQNGITTINSGSRKVAYNPIVINTSVPDSIKVQNKEVNIDSNGITTINSGSDKIAYNPVIINTQVNNQVNTETLKETIEKNGEYEYTPSNGTYYDRALINVNVHPNITSKTIHINDDTENGLHIVYPDNGSFMRDCNIYLNIQRIPVLKIINIKYYDVWIHEAFNMQIDLTRDLFSLVHVNNVTELLNVDTYSKTSDGHVGFVVDTPFNGTASGDIPDNFAFIALQCTNNTNDNSSNGKIVFTRIVNTLFQLDFKPNIIYFKLDNDDIAQMKFNLSSNSNEVCQQSTFRASVGSFGLDITDIAEIEFDSSAFDMYYYVDTFKQIFNW